MLQFAICDDEPLMVRELADLVLFKPGLTLHSVGGKILCRTGKIKFRVHRSRPFFMGGCSVAFCGPCRGSPVSSGQ